MVYVSALFLVGFIFLNGLIYRKRVGTSINPVTVLSYFWFFALFLPILLHPLGYVNILSLVYIIVFILIFSIPFYFFPVQGMRIKFQLNIEFVRKLLWVLRLFFVISLACFFWILSINGVGLLGYLADPLAMTQQLVMAKYADEVQVSLASSIQMFLMFPMAFFGGVLLRFGQEKQVFLLTFSVPILNFVIWGHKGFIFLALFLFLAGVLLIRAGLGYRYFVDGKILIRLSIAFVFLLGLIFFAFMARAGDISGGDLLDFLYKSILSYSSGHVFAFSDWFSFYTGDNSLLSYPVSDKPIGFYTFKFVYDLLGVKVFVPMGIYGEYYADGTIETNIYTVFRGLIFDFGLLGGMVFSLLLGMLLRFSVVALNKRGVVQIVGVMLWYMFFMLLYHSYLISTFTWVSNSLGVFLVAVCFFACKVRFFKNVK